MAVTVEELPEEALERFDAVLYGEPFGQPAFYAALCGLDLARYPNAAAFVKSILARFTR